MLRRLRPVLLGAFLGGCATAGNGDPLYPGDAVQARLTELYLQMEDGTRVPFVEVFRGYRPSGFIGLNFPSRRVQFDIGLVSNHQYQSLFRSFDANGNDFLERPEMTVMYVVQAARGLGYPVSHVGKSARAGAVDTPREDTGGLVAFVQRNSSRMNPWVRSLFENMHHIVEEMRAAQEGGGRFKPN